MRSVPGLSMIIAAGFVTIVAAWASLQSPVHPDEAVFLTVAKGIQQGLLPYRDLFDHKTPAIYYTLSPLVHLPLSNLRLIGIGLLLLTGYLTYRIAKITKVNNASTAGLLTICFSFVYQASFLLTESFMMPFILGAVYLSGIKKHTSYVAIGVLFGIASLYRQYALICLIAYILWLWKESKSVIAVSRIIIGYSLPITASILLAIHAGILHESIAAIISFNLSYATNIHSTVLDYLRVIWPILPLVIAAVWSLRQKRIISKDRLIVYMALASLPQLLIRPYHHYWLQIIPWLTIMAASLPKRHLQVLSIYALVAALIQAAYFYTQRHELEDQLDHARSTPCHHMPTATDYALGSCTPPKYFYSPS